MTIASVSIVIVEMHCGSVMYVCNFVNVYFHVQMIELWLCVCEYACMCVCVCLCMFVCVNVCVHACMSACMPMCVCASVYVTCVTCGDTLVFRNIYALSVAYMYGIKGHASNPIPVYKDIHCSVATGIIYVVL